MKFRMASARCCCGGVAPPSECDPITGTQDTFATLDPKWTILQTIYETVGINPVGTLRILNDSAFFDGLFQLSRCAVFNSTWSSAPSTTRADRARWRIVGSYQLTAGRDDPGGFIPGLNVYGSFQDATTSKTYSLSHGLKFFTGVGWKQRLSFSEPGLASPYVVDLATVVQAAQSPYPIGPFSFDLDLLLDRRQSGANAGSWSASAWFNSGSIFADRDIVAPTSSVSEFAHGFGSEIGNYLADTKIESWSYTT